MLEFHELIKKVQVIFCFYIRKEKTLPKSFLIIIKRNLRKSEFIHMQYFTILKHLLKLSYILIFRNNFEENGTVFARNWTNFERNPGNFMTILVQVKL